MEFRTIVPIKKYNNPIDYSSRIFSIGSCFAEHIGNKFEYYKFRITTNPLGILFSPSAIEKIIKKSISESNFIEEELVYNNDLWHCFDVHSDYSNSSKNNLLNEINSELKTTKKNILNASHIIITLGTAWVYKNLTNQEYVANCHKIPQKNFSKELLSVSEITTSLQNIIDLVNNKNIIFTISPVRHLKDGFSENNLSKAHLISAVHEVVKNNENCNYFPAYEIVLDELRDYRFFDSDMIHPNQITIDYIWKKFSENYFDLETLKINQEVDSIQKALHHRPFNPDTEQHKKFIENTQKRIEKLKNIWF